MLTIVRALVPLCAMALVASAAPAQSKPKSSSTLITQDEIERARPSVGNAFDVVRLLRPRWLGRAREMVLMPQPGSDARMAEIHVYMDERDKGDIEFLRTIPAELIYSLKYMSMTEVGARFGPSSGPGIVVTLKH
ncbi:MAG: hypothetical protein DMD40_09450 [Gemmatimonadetes bacterium]|nr:MAG: hypothetical protein DMD40_09450 [Gemmatimonadota bacterium]